MANFTLKTSSGSNVITLDPDGYSRRLRLLHDIRECLNARYVADIIGIHYNLILQWAAMTSAQYEALRGLFYSGETLYFDDGNVPPLVETATFYAGATYNYVGISAPSTTHIAWMDSQTDIPIAAGDYEASELSTLQYQDIDADDLNFVQKQSVNDGEYAFFKLAFKSGIARANINAVAIKVIASGQDTTGSGEDGFILTAWKDRWVEIGRITGVSKRTLEYSVDVPEVAKQFVDSSDSYIRLFLRPYVPQSGSDTVSITVWYCEVSVNGGSGQIIELTHTPILSGGDVIWVKNLTTAQTLVLGSDYTISGNTITVTGQNDGDIIEVKYNRYYQVVFTQVPENWLPGAPSGDRYRDVQLGLETVTKGYIGS